MKTGGAGTTGEAHLVAHARVSSDERDTDLELDESRAAGRGRTHEEYASGASTGRLRARDPCGARFPARASPARPAHHIDDRPPARRNGWMAAIRFAPLPMLLPLAVALARLLSAVSAHAQPADYPALRVAPPAGATSLLIGSMHQGDARVPLVDPSLLDGARRLVIEGDVALPQPTPRPDLPPPDPGPPIPMGAILDEQEVAVLRSRIACHLPSTPDLHDFALRYALFQPLRIGSSLTAPCPAAGRPGLEGWMKNAAATRSVPVELLESYTDSQAQWGALPDRIFRPGVHRALSPGFERDFTEVVDALNAGAYDRVCHVVREGFATAEDADLFERRMLIERHAHWLPKLEQALQEGRAVVVVGAAHLCGPIGLPALLRGRGYRIERVRVPAAR